MIEILKLTVCKANFPQNSLPSLPSECTHNTKFMNIKNNY